MLRNALIFGFLTISLSVSYYLVIFLPGKESARVEQQKVEKAEEVIENREQNEKGFQKITEQCSQDAKAFHDKYKKEYEWATVLDPVYLYSKKLERCLYIGGFIVFGTKKVLRTRDIKDVYTNETIAHISPRFVNGKNVELEKEEEDKFWKLYDALMNE